MGGGVGSRFGEGESQLEVDRRMVRKRITSIKRELKHLAEVRAVQRESRYESGMFKVALAGYTNAGKSSLLNRLTNADVLAYDKLFATLDSTTRKFELPEGREITVTDTVGFIQMCIRDRRWASSRASSPSIRSRTPSSSRSNRATRSRWAASRPSSSP